MKKHKWGREKKKKSVQLKVKRDKTNGRMRDWGNSRKRSNSVVHYYFCIFLFWFVFFVFFFLLLLFCLLQHKNKSLHPVFFCVFHADNTIFFFVSSNWLFRLPIYLLTFISYCFSTLVCMFVLFLFFFFCLFFFVYKEFNPKLFFFFVI